MAQRTQVPKFGNWDSEEIPYTICFDNARKSKSSDQIYQKDPQERLDMVPKNEKIYETKSNKHHERKSSRDEGEMRRSAASPLHPNTIRPRHDRRPSREEGEMRKVTDSPGLRNSSDSPHHRYGGSSAGDTPRRVSRQSVGSDRSIEHSPMHPRTGGRNTSGVSSPSWERKATSEGSHGLAPSTPGRSRLRSVTRGDDTPDHGPAVPKFGEWDETDPAAAEGYTHIFNRVREEKHSETGKVPVMPTETSYSNGQKQYANDSAKGCGCFPWGKR